jgi:hypothetical protein
MPPHVLIDFVAPVLTVAEEHPTAKVGAPIGRSYVAPMM